MLVSFDCMYTDRFTVLNYISMALIYTRNDSVALELTNILLAAGVSVGLGDQERRSAVACCAEEWLQGEPIRFVKPHRSFPPVLALMMRVHRRGSGGFLSDSASEQLMNTLLSRVPLAERLIGSSYKNSTAIMAAAICGGVKALDYILTRCTFTPAELFEDLRKFFMTEVVTRNDRANCFITFRLTLLASAHVIALHMAHTASNIEDLLGFRESIYQRAAFYLKQTLDSAARQLLRNAPSLGVDFDKGRLLWPQLWESVSGFESLQDKCRAVIRGKISEEACAGGKEGRNSSISNCIDSLVLPGGLRRFLKFEIGAESRAEQIELLQIKVNNLLPDALETVAPFAVYGHQQVFV